MSGSVRRGFTLVEIVVTLAVLGILVGIAAVSWQFFLDRTKEDRASALLDRVATLEQPIARDWGSYTAWPADLSDLGSDVTVMNGTPSTNINQVSVVVGSGGTLAMAVKSDKGACVFRLLHPLSVGGGAETPTVADNATCTAQSALPDSQDPLTQTASIKSSSA